MDLRPLATFAMLAACAASAQSIVPGFDAMRVGFSQTSGMDLGAGNGDLSITNGEIRSVLSRPVSPADGMFLVPFAEYRCTGLDFDGPPAPFDDEDLHSISLSSFFIAMREGSPWLYGAWARAELASDFQHIDGDDFTYDAALGAGYRFSESFTLAFGGAVTNLNGDEQFYPGIGFDWMPADQWRIGLYGPILLAAFTPDEEWLLTFRGDPGGGVWNITDAAGDSRSIDLSSYRLGVYVSRRLAGDFWLTAGTGVVLANELDYTTPHGREIRGLDPDEGWFGMLGLRLKAW